MNLSNNTILITGATSGIGYAMTTRLAALGNTILAVGRSSARLTELADHSANIHPLFCNLADPDELERLVVIVEQQFPNFNVLINNAGNQYNYAVAESSQHRHQIDHEIAVNLTAPIHLQSLLLPQLVGQPQAAIVNVSSGLGLVPKRSAPVYCATKAGLHIFTKSLRYQLVNTTVRVMEVIPPLVDTPMTAGRGRGKLNPDELVDEFLRGFAHDQPEINIGKVKLLRLLQRLSPSLADRLLMNS